jgi:hypothetical protein
MLQWLRLLKIFILYYDVKSISGEDSKMKHSTFNKKLREINEHFLIVNILKCYIMAKNKQENEFLVHDEFH